MSASSSSSSNGTTARASTANSATRKAAMGTLVTVVLRLLSFVGTQWCYRRLDPTALGRANVRLELLLTSILFVSREGFRLALTRNVADSTNDKSKSGGDNDSTSQSNEGVAWWTIPVSSLVSFIMLLWHLHNTGGSSSITTTSEDSDYRMAGMLYCAAAAIEGFGEPVVLYFMRTLSVAEKASAEGLAVLVKTGATVVSLHYLPHWPVSSFGLAQVAYAVTYTTFLYARIWTQRRHFFSFSTASCWHGPTIYLTVVFTLQGVVKFALTEGDRIVLTLLAGSYDQGVYAMGSAYGGLAARLILQPLEENARLLYSRLATTTNNTSTVSATESKSDKEQELQPPRQKALDPMLSISYTVLVKMVLYVGLVFSCLAVNYTQILLSILAGAKWGHNTEAVAVLSAFCVYTAFLAWNGMTEAFCYGIAQTAADVGRLGLAHSVTGIVFAVASPWAVARFGTVGLVAANCVAMLGRALFSVHFAARYFASHNANHNDATKPKNVTTSSILQTLLPQMFPVPLVLLAFGAAYIGTRASAERMAVNIAINSVESGSRLWFQYAVEHIGVGVAAAIVIASLAYSLETDFRRNMRKLWNDKSA